MISRLSKAYNLFRKNVNRNNIILNDFTRKTIKNSVNLHWWSPLNTNKDGQEKNENLGDYLAVLIFGYLLDMHRIDKNVCYGKKHLYTVGSIIFMGLQNAVIWGSGLLYEDKLPTLVTDERFSRFKIKLDIRAVRGPKTREVLLRYGYDCPEVYGDPAILMPLIYNPVCEKFYEYTVIHHMSSKSADEGVSILTTDYKAFIDRIVQSKLVISGSLHGIILAEAYGVPAILLKDRTNLDMFKYMDYYYGTGRKDFPVAETISEALTMKKLQPPDFSNMQRQLLNAFPTDLWE